MRSESVWAGEEEARAKPRAISMTTYLLAAALAGTAVWSAALWAYQFWINVP